MNMVSIWYPAELSVYLYRENYNVHGTMVSDLVTTRYSRCCFYSAVEFAQVGAYGYHFHTHSEPSYTWYKQKW